MTTAAGPDETAVRSLEAERRRVTPPRPLTAPVANARRAADLIDLIAALASLWTTPPDREAT